MIFFQIEWFFQIELHPSFYMIIWEKLNFDGKDVEFLNYRID